MAKDRWQNESVSMQNPFAALSGLKTTSADSAPAVEPEVKESAKQASIKLPKVKCTRLERAQRGGKTVTVVSFHGEPSDDAKQAWLKQMKKTLGVGGAVEGENVVLQGDQRDRV